LNNRVEDAFRRNLIAFCRYFLYHYSLKLRLTQTNLLMKTNPNVFSNKEITVTYEPNCCENSGFCAKQLSNVFRHSVIPWIDLDGAETKTIIAQINKCPSGALKYHFYNKKTG